MWPVNALMADGQVRWMGRSILVTLMLGVLRDFNSEMSRGLCLGARITPRPLINESCEPRPLVRILRALRPELRVLFITGFAENAVIGNGHLAAGMAVITKPFAIGSLGQKIHDLIGR
jgi:hypothetical protein